MKGRVKWFSSDLGYGFIVDETGGQHYFQTADVNGLDHPKNRESVFFVPAKNKKGSRATKIQRTVEPPTPAKSETSVTSNALVARCHLCNDVIVSHHAPRSPSPTNRNLPAVWARYLCAACTSNSRDSSANRTRRPVKTFWLPLAFVLATFAVLGMLRFATS